MQAYHISFFKKGIIDRFLWNSLGQMKINWRWKMKSMDE